METKATRIRFRDLAIRHGLGPEKQSALFVWTLMLIFCTGINAELPAKSSKRPAKGWQIRGGHNGLSSDFSMLAAMARNGMNSVFTSGAEHFLGADGKPTMRLADSRNLPAMNRWQRETHALGMQYFPLSNIYGTGDRKRWPLTRSYVGLDGKKRLHTPCPNDAEFWHGKITNVFVEIARWARDKPNVPGIILDTEMYGADRSSFPDACFCEDCRPEIARELGVDVNEIDLKDQAFLNSYRDASTRILERIYEQTRQQVRAVNPDCLLGGYILDHGDAKGMTPPFYKAITRAWGTPKLPVLVFSESTYSPGYHATYARAGKPLIRATGSYIEGRPSKFGQGDHPGYIQEWIKRWKEWGAHAQFVGGLWLDRIPEENLAENLYHMAKNTRGYWIYEMLSLGDNPRSRLPGGGRPAYWQAIAQANRELDEWLESGGSYVSDLKMRPFTLPAPGVSVQLWEDVDLPLIKARAAEAEFLFRRGEQIFCIPAAEGGEVKLTIIADSAHAYKLKVDAVAIVLVNPDGEVIKQDKLTMEDFDKTRRPDGRYGGKREVSFRAPKTGTYGLFLKGIRYAYTLGPCSHPWVASFRKSRAWFYNPKRIYLKTLPGANEAKLSFGRGDTTTMKIFDERGNQLALQKVGSHEQVITIPLQPEPQMLTATFEGGPLVKFTVLSGLQPWFSGSVNAPFPP